MRRWGILISLVYAFIVVGLLVPAVGLLCGISFTDLPGMYTEWAVWLPVGMILVGQAVLMFVAADTSQRRLKPRASVLVTAITTSMLFLMLTVAAVFDVLAAVLADRFDVGIPNRALAGVGILLAIWAGWGVVFYLYLRGKTEVVARAMGWLLKGSILELLIAVPSHVIVRRRGDCSAPIATGFGITTGIAIMLLSFGPSVLLLYKKRMEAYRAAGRHAPVH
jgi:hypothetical protein